MVLAPTLSPQGGLSMPKNIKSVMPLFCFFMATLLIAFAAAQRPVWASPDKTQHVKIISQLNELRDTISFNWALTLKHGWNARVILDDPKGTKNNETAMAPLELLFAESSQADEIKKLIQTVKEIKLAEKKYLHSLVQAEEAASNILTNSSEMARAGAVVNIKANAIVFDKKSIETTNNYEINPEEIEKWKNWNEERFTKPSGKSNLEKNIEPQNQPAETTITPLEEQPSSDDPKMLRLAYQANQASVRFNFQLLIVSNDALRAMYEETWPAPVHFKIDQKSLDRGLEAIKNLPGLSEMQRIKLEQIPQYFQEAVANIAIFDKQLKQKKQAHADLEHLVESALSQIDELRGYHLNLIIEE